MSNLIRMCYGRSGSTLGRVIVSAPCRESAPDPRWLRVLEVLFWILVPVLVLRFAVPPTSRQMTIIDMSQLTEKPVIETEKTVLHEPVPLPKIQPQEQRERARTEVERKIQDTVDVVQPKELKPEIIRPSAARTADPLIYQPRIARERIGPETGAGPAGVARIRRGTAGVAAPAGAVTITRSRGAAVVDVPVAVGYRVASPRRTPVAGGSSSGAGAGDGVVLRPSGRSGRTYGYGGTGTSKGSGPVVVATRGRPGATGTGGGGTSSVVGLSRGVSLMSLGICSSPQEEEDHVRAVLGVIGSRQSCTNDKGEFSFKGTQRISSFNLMIFPSKGRRPSNRCEELEYAYRCLTSH